MNPSYSVIMVYGVSSSWTRRISKDSIQKLLNEIRHCVVFAVLLYVGAKKRFWEIRRTVRSLREYIERTGRRNRG
jgi:hypothetical protein